MSWNSLLSAENIGKGILLVTIFAVWLFILHVLKKTKLDFWHFVVGGAGTFVMSFVLLRPVLTEPLARVVALFNSLVGQITGMYSTYYKYGTIFIDSVSGALSLKIDFECSGIIEILAFLSLLAFFKVYTVAERVLVGIVGTLAIIVSNAIRLTVICTMIYFGGVEQYYLAHTIVGRLVFYGLSVALYFYVFTKPQIIKQKVGSFHYDNPK